MAKILAINGSYRDDGITDQTVEDLAQAIVASGAEVVGSLFTGMIAKQQQLKLPEGVRAGIDALAGRLV